MNELGHIIFAVSRAGTAGRRPRMLGARVIGFSDGGTDVVLNGSEDSPVYGLVTRPEIKPSLRINMRVRVQAVGSDHTVVAVEP